MQNEYHAVDRNVTVLTGSNAFSLAPLTIYTSLTFLCHETETMLMTLLFLSLISLTFSFSGSRNFILDFLTTEMIFPQSSLENG